MQPVNETPAQTDELLEEKLRRSVSFESLVTERAILQQVRELGWRCSHGAFFVDPSTSKIREADILATRYWRRHRRTGDLTVALHVPIEVKSARGFHIIFSLESGGSFRTFHQENVLWLGQESDGARLMADRVAALGFSQETVRQFQKQLYAKAYPKHFSCVAELIVEPYEPGALATAFRETNIGGEKDLENSVLWKATQTLGSLVDSLKRSSIEARFEDAEVGVACARRDGDDDRQILNDLLDAVRDVGLYHPIVVIDAPLWAVTKQHELFRIPACRFEQVQLHHGFSRWVDVVHRSHFDTFVTDLTTYYENAFEKAKLKPL
jgi:hypothetical protein